MNDCADCKYWQALAGAFGRCINPINYPFPLSGEGVPPMAEAMLVVTTNLTTCTAWEQWMPKEDQTGNG